jgi:hypothetical protein
MPMSPRLLRPIASRSLVDADAAAYLAAVQDEDAQALEPAVRNAITAFVVGCKADGIWDAIKACCILMGARTLSGTLTPLKGGAPTNNGPFVSGDYSRKTGLTGNGTTKWLNANRANDADPQDSNHMAVYVTAQPSTAIHIYIGSNGVAAAGGNSVFANTANTLGVFSRSTNNSFTLISGQGTTSGLKGISRGSSSSFVARSGGSSQTISTSSVTPTSEGVGVFARTPSSPTGFNPATMAFYSIGESLDLALLDTRVTNLYNAIGAAIP